MYNLEIIASFLNKNIIIVRLLF